MKHFCNVPKKIFGGPKLAETSLKILMQPLWSQSRTILVLKIRCLSSFIYNSRSVDARKIYVRSFTRGTMCFNFWVVYPLMWNKDSIALMATHMTACAVVAIFLLSLCGNCYFLPSLMSLGKHLNWEHDFQKDWISNADVFICSARRTLLLLYSFSSRNAHLCTNSKHY